jgi:mycoredoxin
MTGTIAAQCEFRSRNNQDPTAVAAEATHDKEARPMGADTTSAEAVTADTLTMYTTTWCGYCRRLKTQLKSEGIDWVEVDIEQVPDAAAFVESVNGGNQTVPTVLYPNGTTATNPSLADVKAALGR